MFLTMKTNQCAGTARRVLLVLILLVAAATVVPAEGNHFVIDSDPLHLTSYGFGQGSIGMRELELVFANGSEGTVVAWKFELAFADAFGDDVEYFGRTRFSFRRDNREIAPGDSAKVTFGAMSFSTARTITEYQLTAVAFDDGTVWEGNGTGGRRFRLERVLQ